MSGVAAEEQPARHFSGDVRFRAIVPSQRYGCTWPIGGDPRCAVLRSRKHVRGVIWRAVDISAVIERVQAEPCVHLAAWRACYEELCSS